MIEIVNYRRCVCDRCGKEERMYSSDFPTRWTAAEVGGKRYDFCDDCSREINDMVKELILRGTCENIQFHGI